MYPYSTMYAKNEEWCKLNRGVYLLNTLRKYLEAPHFCCVHFFTRYSHHSSIDGGVWTICGATPAASRCTKRCRGGRCR